MVSQNDLSVVSNGIQTPYVPTRILAPFGLSFETVSGNHSNLDGILERFELRLKWYPNTIRT